MTKTHDTLAKLRGPTWWLPVDDEAADCPEASQYVEAGGQLYIPVEEAKNWCIEIGSPRYGYARLLGEGFYAFAKAVCKPRLGYQAWLMKLELLVEPSIVAGPYLHDVPDHVIVEKLKKAYREDDLYFTVYFRDGQISVESFSGGTMDALRAKAGVA